MKLRQKPKAGDREREEKGAVRGVSGRESVEAEIPLMLVLITHVGNLCKQHYRPLPAWCF
jgi:hypothetical protein